MTAPFTGGLSLQDVVRAKARLASQVARTPLIHSAELARRIGSPVFLKLENQQHTGSFKLRGALNAVLSLPAERRERGVVTVSTGNHGRAVAYACRRLGVRATVCVSELVPRNKLDAIEELGARLVVHGRGQDEAQLEAERLVERDGLTLVPPFDNGDVIAGQGTIGLEIVEQLAQQLQADAPGEFDVLVPLSGGGLIAGVALALHSVNAAIRVFGVSSERCCAMRRSIEAGEPTEVEELESLADSLGGGIGLSNRYTFGMVRDLVDHHLLVGEEQIAAGIVHAYRSERQIVEGAAAVGIAALLADAGQGAPRPGDDGRPVVVLLTGSNIDMNLHEQLLVGAAAGRQPVHGPETVGRANGVAAGITGGGDSA